MCRSVWACPVEETVENIGVLSTGLSTKASKTGLVEETVENIGVLSTALSTKASKTPLVDGTVENIGVLSTTLSTTLDFTINIITAPTKVSAVSLSLAVINYFFSDSARIAVLRILPEIVFGSSSTNSTILGYL